MTLELIVFVASILFGILLYWRESTSNGLYRFFNKLMYSKELQMKTEDRTGFLYQQSFLLRLVFITFIFLIGIVITRFLIPIDLATISVFASSIVGTLVGTYLATLVFKSNQLISKKSDSIEDMVQDTVEKGKDIVQDTFDKGKGFVEQMTHKEKEVSKPQKEAPKPEEKSARERLKDKGLL